METMTPANSGLTAILCGVLIGLSGCGQADTTNPLMADNDSLLNELLGSADDQADSKAEADSAADDDSAVETVSSGLEIPSTENDTSESIVDDILGSRTSDPDSLTAALTGSPALDLSNNVSIRSSNSATSPRSNAVQLKAGDQFPFVKTVRQTVVQTTTNATQARTDQVTAETLMQLTMNLSVLDSNAGGHIMHVRYERVQYLQNVNGQQQNYDSAAQSHSGQGRTSVPAGIEAYVGMVGAGFRFTLNSDNKVASTEGLSTFLDQCVSSAPFEQRVNIRASLEQRFKSNAIAELVDESIGLLPYGASSVQMGDVWMTDRQLQQQSPIQMQTTCRLLSKSAATAEIGLTGRIESAAGAQFTISDGRTMGTCIVNVATGMPIQSQRSSYLKISSQPTSQQSVEITKRIETTFTSQSESAKLMVQQHRLNASIQAASASRTAPPYNSVGNSVGNTAAVQTAPSRSAMLPSNNSNNFRSTQNQFSNSNLQVQPISSANTYQGSGTNSGLQIPSGGTGSVPATDLQSSVEAVYPD